MYVHSRPPTPPSALKHPPIGYRVEISGSFLRGDHIEYQLKLYDINGDVQSLTCRYREMRELNNTMKMKHPSGLPPFPGKKFFGNTDPNFIIQRAKQLQDYFDCLLQLDPMCESVALRRFLRLDVSPNTSTPRSTHQGYEIDGNYTQQLYTSDEEISRRKDIDTILNLSKLQMIDLALPLNFDIDPTLFNQYVQDYQDLLNRNIHTQAQPIVLPNTYNDYHKWPTRNNQSNKLHTHTTSNKNNKASRKTFNSFIKMFNEYPQSSHKSYTHTDLDTTNTHTDLTLLTTPLDSTLLKLTRKEVVPTSVPTHIVNMIDTHNKENFLPINKHTFLSLLEKIVYTHKQNDDLYEKSKTMQLIGNFPPLNRA